MGSGRLGKTRAAALAAMAIAAPALAQPADPDGPVPTARYERPPAGVDPSILDRPPPPQPTPAPNRVQPAAAPPAISLPEAPVVRRRGLEAPASLETPAAQPTERPWERQSVGAMIAPTPQPPPPPQAQAAAPPPPPRPARPPVVRMVELQIGAFADRSNAERAARTARMAGPTRIQPVTVAGVTLHRVIVGPGGEAAMRAALARLGFGEARPVRGP